LSCAEKAVNLMELQIFPTSDGRVIDELIVHTPGGWSSDDVEAATSADKLRTSALEMQKEATSGTLRKPPLTFCFTL
jgi:UTP:GlnB (protein PII) uridylyltransferase